MDRCSLHSHFADAGAHTKGDIQRYSLAGRELHALRNFSPEPFLLHTDVVKRSCGGGSLQVVTPAGIGVRHPTRSRINITDRDFGIRNHRTGGIRHGPEDGAVTCGLRVGPRCARAHEDRHAKSGDERRTKISSCHFAPSLENSAKLKVGRTSSWLFSGLLMTAGFGNGGFLSGHGTPSAKLSLVPIRG